jgi:hypothetical protein
MRIYLIQPLIFLLVTFAPWAAMRADPAPDQTNQAFEPAVAAWTEADFRTQRAAAVQLNQKIQAAITRGDKTFTIPPGNYRFHPDSLANLHLLNAHDLTIEAQGVTFWLYPFQREDGVLLDHCRDVTIHGLTADYYPATYPQGDIVAIDPAQGYIDFQLAPGFSTPMDVPNHLEGAKLVHFDQSGNLLPNRLDWVREVQDLGGGRYRVFPKGGWAYKSKSAVVPGTVLALAGRSMRMAFSLKDCAHCTLEDITVYASPHMAFTELFGDGGHVYRRCRVIRRPGTRRFLACNADVFHSIGLAHGSTVEDCEFSFSGDDLMNIHGLLSLVYDQPAPNTVDVLTQMGSDLPPDTTLGFFGFTALDPKGEAKVVKTTPIDNPALAKAAAQMITDKQLAFLKPPRLIRVQTDRALKVEKYDLVTGDLGVSKGVIVRHNFLHDCPTRGILMKSSEGLIENNRFDNIGMGSIAVANDLHFMEGPFPSHITVADNTITRNGYNGLISSQSWTYYIGAISVTSEQVKGLSAHASNFDIKVLRNRIEDSVNCGIFFSNVDGGEIVGNTIIGAFSREPAELGGRMGLVDPCYGLVVTICRNVKVQDNQFEKPGKYCRGNIAFLGQVTDVGPQAPGQTQ